MFNTLIEIKEELLYSLVIANQASDFSFSVTEFVAFDSMTCLNFFRISKKTCFSKSEYTVLLGVVILKKLCFIDKIYFMNI